MTPTSERAAAAGAWLRELHERAQAWVERQPADPLAQTPAYVDLSFAFGLAKVGAAEPACELLGRGQAALCNQMDESHTWLCGAYESRVRQALAGKPTTGPLPPAQVEYLETLDPLQRYVIDRLRKHSRILEPNERINPYRWSSNISDFDRELAELTDFTDRERFANRVGTLLDQAERQKRSNPEQTARVIRAALDRASFAGVDFTRDLLVHVLQLWPALPPAKMSFELRDRASFLERAISAAVTFRLAPEFGRLRRLAEEWLFARQPEWGTDAEVLFTACLNGLFHLNLPDEADQFLYRSAQQWLQGRSVSEIAFVTEEDGISRLHLLLRIAAGWYAFGWNSLADPVLERTRAILFGVGLAPREQTRLASASATALRLATRDVADMHFRMLFDQLGNVRDTYTTASHFSLSHLEVIESVVLAASEVRGRA